MISVKDAVVVAPIEKAVRRGRPLSCDAWTTAVEILTRGDETERLARLDSDQAAAIRAQMDRGGRPTTWAVEWLRERDPKYVTAWQTEKTKRSSRKNVAQRVAEHVARRSELGEMPEVDQAAIVARIKDDPVWACWHYFPEWFTRPPSSLTTQVINKIWSVMLAGGNQSIGVLRGGGKSTITKSLLTLAGLCGMVHYAVIFGANASAAKQLRRDIVYQLEINQRLLEDFPAACIPIRALGGRAQRAAGQVYRGERTYIRYEGDVIQLARIPDALSSGFLLRCTGIESGFLGLIDNGVRPDFVLGDDIQSLEAAKSDDEVARLERAIRQGFEGLGGKANPLRIVLLATCTREGDFSDRVLTPEIYPEYSGLRLGLVEQWGTGVALWEEYCEVWRQCQRDGDKRFEAATTFYANNRGAMDDGVIVTDPEFYVRGLELSAIQAAWNSRIKMGDDGYFAQMENRPVSPRTTLYDLTPSHVSRSLNRLRRREVPSWATGLFSFSDVGNDKLRWGVAAFGPRMKAAVVDYGIWPERGPVVPKNSSPQAALDHLWRAQYALASQWANTAWLRDGQPMRIMAGGFDRGYMPEAIQQFCASALAAKLPFPVVPLRGNGWKQWRAYNRATIRQGWNVQMVRTIEGYAPGEFINVRTDFWKETVQRAFLCDDPDAPGACSLWGTDARSHGEFSDQICGEILSDKGRGGAGTEFWNFTIRPGSQNHFLDALVGCYALASFFGHIRPDDQDVIEGGVAAPMFAAQQRRETERRTPRRQPKIPLEA